jgi:uncharacterized protein YecE (DUF72 family)
MAGFLWYNGMARPRLLIGCSGFSYKEWKGLFYPEGLPAKAWFEYYCDHFSTVELNVTFYRFPALETLSGWYRRSPDDFVFSVKAPRVITHYKHFEQTEALQQSFYSLIKEGLGDKLGPVLYQLPTTTVYSPVALDKILRHMDPGFANVIEFRHVTWWREDVYDALRDKGVTFCGTSYPDLPDWVIPGRDMVYYRFHGVPSLYRSSYSPAFLERVLEQVEGRDAYLYFNNTASGAAIRNAEMIQRKLH